MTMQGIHFVGAGVSGGEEGALNGPSIMPGGAIEAWPVLKPIFQGIAAKVDGGEAVGGGGCTGVLLVTYNGRDKFDRFAM